MSSSSVPTTPESYVASSPCCLHSPSPLETPVDHFATYFDAFDHHQPQHHALHKSFDLPQQLHLFADNGACAVNTPYISHDFVAPLHNNTTMIKDHNGYASYEHLGKSEMGQQQHHHHQLGLDFSTLVASLPPYTI
jgi:hypothetical protein